MRRLHGLRVVRLVFLALFRRRRVDLLEVAHRERRFRGVRSREGIVKIRQLRMAVADLGDDKAHLQAPVTQMNVAGDLIAAVPADPLQSIADDGRAQVSDVERFCDVRSAVVEDDFLRLISRGKTELSFVSCRRHFTEVCRKEALFDVEIEEAGLYGFHLGEDGILRIFSELRRDRVRNHERCLVVLLCARHGAVALEFG